MKKIIKTLLLVLVILFGGCKEDFLEVKQITSKTTETYYATPEDVQEALVGCYDALQLLWSNFYPYSGQGTPVISEVMSDLCFGGTGKGDDRNFEMIDEFDLSVYPVGLNELEGNWVNCYKGIYRCNMLINNINKPKWKSNQLILKGRVEGEAKFLRAFFYFELVRMFENIPLITVPAEENVPQANPDDVYSLIANDLLFAIENCDSTEYSKITASNFGHSNKSAAEAMLARVFLYYTGYYNSENLVGKVSKAEALAYLEDIISFSGHGLVGNYYDLWPAASTYEAAKSGRPIDQSTYAGETNKEVLFAIKYTYTSDYNGNTDGNHWMVMNGLRGANWPKFGYATGWGGCTVVPSLYSSWPAGDKRRDASIMGIAEEGITSYGRIQREDQWEYTGYFTKKYIPRCDKTGKDLYDLYGGVDLMLGQFQDYYVVRYADVLLMAAELGSPKAIDYVNLVRGRAGYTTQLQVINKDIIFEERKLEFAFEGLRYWDLLRYDHTLVYAANKLAYNGTVFNVDKSASKVILPANFLTKRGLCAIPLNQITLSGGLLKQNQGWE